MHNKRLLKVARHLHTVGLHSIAQEIEEVVGKDFLDLLDKKIEKIDQLNSGEYRRKELICEKTSTGDEKAKVITDQNGQVDVHTFDDIEEAVEFYNSYLVDDLQSVAQHLLRKNLRIAAQEIETISSEIENISTQSALDDILSYYKEIHKVANNSNVKRAEIRKNDLVNGQCPFGLSIPTACSNVGAAIYKMVPDPECFEENREVYETDKTNKPCPFADDILHKQKAVNCSWGTTTQGYQAPEVYRGSPIYPRLWTGFNTVNIDRAPQSDFGYGAGFYR